MFDEKLRVDMTAAVESTENELIQIADLFVSSRNRVLNASGERTSPKDRFADHLLERLGLPAGPTMEEHDGDPLAKQLRRRSAIVLLHGHRTRVRFPHGTSEIRFDKTIPKGHSFTMNTVQVELPEELFALANVSGTPSRSASQLIALELFRERRVSAGKAAELAGVSLDEFLEFAARREVPMHYTKADWEQDQGVARKLKL